MSEEEKEARYLINILEDKKFTAQGEALRTYIEKLNKDIDKLQKENEELKKQIESRYYHTINARELEKEINNNWENKIRAEIKKLEEMDAYGVLFETAINFAIIALKELLGDDE